MWPDELVKLHTEFVSHEDMENLHEILVDTVAEFERHKVALADKVLDLRLKVEEDAVNAGSNYLTQISNNEHLLADLARIRAENRKLKSELDLAETELNQLLHSCAHESKQLELKARAMMKSAPIVQPVLAPVPKKVARSGVSVSVEHFPR
jgi:hypothetical protein